MLPLSPLSTVARLALEASPRRAWTAAVGRAARVRLPPVLGRAVVGAYSRWYGVRLADAEPAEYATLNDFFTRRLRAGARPIDSAPLVSPVDGTVSATGTIDGDLTLFVKGRPTSLRALVGPDVDLAPLLGGRYAVLYLAPGDYHRVHSPVDGAVRAVRHLPGDRFPLFSTAVAAVPRVFERNERLLFELATEAGPVVLVLVAALGVGHVSLVGRSAPPAAPLQQPQKFEGACADFAAISPHIGHEPAFAGDAGTQAQLLPHVVRRGDELATFHLGSTTVVLVPPGVTLRRSEGPILLGQSLQRS